MRGGTLFHFRIKHICAAYPILSQLLSMLVCLDGELLFFRGNNDDAGRQGSIGYFSSCFSWFFFRRRESCSGVAGELGRKSNLIRIFENFDCIFLNGKNIFKFDLYACDSASHK